MKLLDNIKFRLRKIKWSYQRVKKGYSDWDASEIDMWFLDVVPNMLKDFKKMHQGIPSCVFIDYFNEHPELGTYNNFVSNWDKNIEDQVRKEWDKILDRMIYCFTEADEDKCALTSKEDTIDYYEEVNRYCDERLKEGFDLFYKYFYNLWN